MPLPLGALMSSPEWKTLLRPKGLRRHPKTLDIFPMTGQRNFLDETVTVVFEALVPVLAQLPTLHRQQNSASRLPGVGTVREPAIQRHLVDLRERLVHAVTRSQQAQLTHPGRIDQHGPMVQDE